MSTTTIRLPDELKARIAIAAANGKRELVIGRKSHGYVALYQYVDELNTVFVLALRGQREAGYARSGG